LPSLRARALRVFRALSVRRRTGIFDHLARLRPSKRAATTGRTIVLQDRGPWLVGGSVPMPPQLAHAANATCPASGLAALAAGDFPRRAAGLHPLRARNSTPSWPARMPPSYAAPPPSTPGWPCRRRASPSERRRDELFAPAVSTTTRCVVTTAMAATPPLPVLLSPRPVGPTACGSRRRLRTRGVLVPVLVRLYGPPAQRR